LRFIQNLRFLTGISIRKLLHRAISQQRHRRDTSRTLKIMDHFAGDHIDSCQAVPTSLALDVLAGVGYAPYPPVIDRRAEPAVGPWA
jgi:hypothetical protein